MNMLESDSVMDGRYTDSVGAEFKVGNRVIRNDGLGPTMVVDDVFSAAGQVWLSLECDGGDTKWPGSLFLDTD
jgi:hypothetical protein